MTNTQEEPKIFWIHCEYPDCDYGFISNKDITKDKIQCGRCGRINERREK